MKKALICPNELVPNGFRIAQVEPEENIFSVADPLYWVECADEVTADFWYFDPADATIKAVPVPPPPAPKTVGDTPNVIA